MNFKTFGPFTVYWCEKSIVGDARIHFSASSFNLNDQSLWPLLSDIQDELQEATDFFYRKKTELLLDTINKNKNEEH